MASKLFASHTFGMPLPAPFNGADLVKSRSDVKSKHRPTLTRLTLHAPTLRAAMTLLNAQRGSGKAAVGRQGNTVLVERENSKGGIEIAVYDPNKGDFKAAILDDADSQPEAYKLKKDGKDGTILFMAIIMAHSLLFDPAGYDEEQHDFMSEMGGLLDSGDMMDDDELSKNALIFCDNIYTRIESADSLEESGIKAVISSTSNIQPLTRLAIEQATYAPKEIFFGEFRVFRTDGAKRRPFKPVSNSELPGKYAFSERDFTPEELSLIPSVPAWYIVPPEVVRICEHAKATTDSNMPMRNFMMRGPAGGGKTEGAKAIAAGIYRPYLFQTCSANSEIFDLLGQILPDAEGMGGESRGVADGSAVADFEKINLPKLPSLQDIQIDPATAYKTLTGVYDENITESEVYNKLIEVVMEFAAKQFHAGINPTTGEQKFRYVETPLVKAMKYGYVIEIQEPSVIANPGVLVGLNSLLDGCKQITLPTGEIVNRHPDTVVVVTTNNDYAGCRDINQSIISRMNLIMDVDEPSKKDLVERVEAITGCDNDEALNLMATVIKDIQHHCRSLHIFDGSCGMRELISWAQSFMVTGNMAESAEYTVISSVSADPANRAQIKETCILPRVA